MKSASKILFLVAIGIALPVMGNPTNPSVVAGSATMINSGPVLTVNNSNGAIINWTRFSIAVGETTRFIQPSSSSSVLNRVILSDPSVILGTLSSNGHIFLINPSGYMVGASARIDTAGMSVSASNVSNTDFLAGNARLEAPLSANSIIPGGNIAIGGSSSGGSPVFTGGSVSLGPTGSTLQGALAPKAPPTAPNTPPSVATSTSPAGATIGLNTAGLVNGAVTVRISLVDASPITLR